MSSDFLYMTLRGGRSMFFSIVFSPYILFIVAAITAHSILGVLTITSLNHLSTRNNRGRQNSAFSSKDRDDQNNICSGFPALLCGKRRTRRNVGYKTMYLLQPLCVSLRGIPPPFSPSR